MAVVLGEAALAQPRPSVITNPDWLRRPDAAVIAETYPTLASTLRLEGRAIISCSLDAIGRARDCVVIGESPAGLGFGQAALKASESFRFRPKLVDGRPVAGGTVRVPMRYQLPEPEEMPPEPESPKAATPANAAMAAKLSTYFQAGLLEGYDAMARKMEAEAQTGVDPRARALALKALMGAARSLAPAAADAVAAENAATATEAQMAALIAYSATPEAKAIHRRDPEIRTAFEGLAAQASVALWTTANAAYCTGDRCMAREPDQPAGVGVFAPTWRTGPTPQQVTDGRPALAQMFGVGGWGQLNCIVTDSGGLSFCVDRAESPQGFQFGDAAQRLSKFYRLSKADMDRGAQGETVSVLVEFPRPTPPSDQAGPGEAPSAPRMALARRLTALDDSAKSTASEFAVWEVGLKSGRFPDGEAMLRALRTAMAQVMPAYDEKAAEIYAKLFNETELRALIDVRSGPASAIMTEDRARVRQTTDDINAYYARAIIDQARRNFCAEWTCVSRSPVP